MDMTKEEYERSGALAQQIIEMLLKVMETGDPAEFLRDAILVFIGSIEKSFR